MKAEGYEDPMPPAPARAGLTGDPNAAPRCGARTRQHASCRQPAMPNGRCRLHGGKSTGPRTAEGMERLRAARTIHGRHSAENRRLRAMVRELMRQSRALVELV